MTSSHSPDFLNATSVSHFSCCITFVCEYAYITQDQLELLISIEDDDFGIDDSIDEILVPFSSTVRLSSTFSPQSTYTGVCGRARITISFRISSSCPVNMYGPSCSVTCMDQANQSFCNYLGERQCPGNFQGPNCEMCVQNYYPRGTCNVLCQPRNDFQGHFTCDSDGNPVCLPGFTNVASMCTEEVTGKYAI